MVGVEQWAQLRREHFVSGKSIKRLARETGVSRNTIRAALRSDRPPSYGRAPAGSKLDPFKEEIHRLLRQDPKLPGVRVRELLEPLGCAASKTVVDDYLREVRPLFAPPARTFQRTVYPARGGRPAVASLGRSARDGNGARSSTESNLGQAPEDQPRRPLREVQVASGSACSMPAA